MDQLLNSGRLRCMILFLFTGLPSASAAEAPDDIVVFVNNASSVSAVTVAELRQIFLRKKSSWPDGGQIVCMHAPEPSPVRARFRETVLGMSDMDEKAYWADQKVRGQLSPPPTMANLAKAVFRLRNGVGYAYRKDVPSGVVKIVLTIPSE